MKRIFIKDKNKKYHLFYLDFKDSQSKRIEVENVCIIDIFKIHNHRYDFKSFFYNTKYIYCENNIRTLKELYNVIQNLIAQN